MRLFFERRDGLFCKSLNRLTNSYRLLPTSFTIIQTVDFAVGFVLILLLKMLYSCLLLDSRINMIAIQLAPCSRTIQKADITGKDCLEV